MRADTPTPITADMKVAEVVDERPESIDVFLSHGCPDMRRGIFRLMSHIMTVRRAAFIHRIPLETLVDDLNAAGATRPETRAPETAEARADETPAPNTAA